MKFCPYCGASLLGGAASFCAECGKEVPAGEKRPQPERKSPAAGKRFPAGNHKSLKSKKSKTRRPPPFRQDERQPGPEEPQGPDPRDEGYDGYYDDVQPIDDGQTRDRLDPELIKRAAFVAAGALGIIILAVILMYVL
jgi:hypothetical protein